MAAGNLAYGLGIWVLVPYFATTWAVWLLTVVAGALGARRYRKLWAGTMVGAWSGLVGGVIGLVTMLTLALTAMPVLVRDPENLREFAGASDLRTAIAADFLAAGINHLVAVGIIFGTVLATLGAAVGVATVGVRSAARLP
jgi:hypothetical protein